MERIETLDTLFALVQIKIFARGALPLDVPCTRCTVEIFTGLETAPNIAINIEFYRSALGSSPLFLNSQRQQKFSSRSFSFTWIAINEFSSSRLSNAINTKVSPSGLLHNVPSCSINPLAFAIFFSVFSKRSYRVTRCIKWKASTTL